ncbi:MAG: type II toxin-antitoxin system RelE/ParE family toxin [Bacteroidetes bacterium]|nr:MAG: type II toxin-antitoxin system RelE/ParE family toxin [Bacteroidota bacterium]
MQREIIVFGTHFLDFFNKLDSKTKEKVSYVLDLVKFTSIIPEKFLKHIQGTDGIYEIRIKSGSNIYRIFCCFDKGNLVVLFNGFQKKDQKIPKNEIELADKLKQEYFKTKPRNGK